MSIAKRVEKIIKIVNGCKIYEIEIWGPFTKIRIRKGSTVQNQDERTGKQEPVPEEDEYYITSPWVGTVHLKTGSNEKPPVKVGEKIEPDMLLCVVKIMGTMNEIRADKSGTITGILVEDDQPVEYGTKLFEVKPGEEKP